MYFKELMKERKEFFVKLSQKFKLEEGEYGITRLLSEIYRAGTINIKELSRQIRIPISVVSGLVNTIMESGLLSRNKWGVLFTEDGMKWAEKTFGFYGSGLPECVGCYNRPFELTKRFDEYWDTIEEAFEKRPGVNTTIDQSLLDAESAVQKVSFMYSKSALEGMNVLILGDDDFVGFAIASFYKLFFPKEPHLLCAKLVIADIDDRILKVEKQLINELSSDMKVEFIKYDFRDPLPQNLLNQFDTVITDPPYSLSGATLFLSRGVAALKKDETGQVFFSYAHRSPEKMVEIHKNLTMMGLAANEIIPCFNYYEGSEILGNTTQLFHLLAIRGSTPIISEAEKFEGPIYTAEFNPKKRFYECSECGKYIEVLPGGNISTIEVLKEKGCPFCKTNNKFKFLDFEKIEEE